MLNGNIVTDKSILFAMNEPICHELKVDPTSDKILKVWVKEPTWLEVEKAMAALMKIDAKKQDVGIDLNAMYKFMAEKFVVKTEPHLSSIDLLRLTPYIGNQLKEILPNPFDAMAEDEEKND